MICYCCGRKLNDSDFKYQNGKRSQHCKECCEKWSCKERNIKVQKYIMDILSKPELDVEIKQL